MLHQTWAYAQNSTHDGFNNYSRDQLTMYAAITDATHRVKENVPDISFIIPSGTAVQNGRTSAVGDNFCRDGYHLDLQIGRYTAACTWFEKITGVNVVGNKAVPSGLDDFQRRVAQNAAHLAVLEPEEVSLMNEFIYEGDTNSNGSTSYNEKSEIDAVIEKGLSVSVEQSKLMAQSLWDQKNLLPRTIDREGKLVASQSHWWTSGFFPGLLWYLYEATNDTLLKHYAEDYTLRVEKEKYDKGTHDLGFKMYCSFGNAYRLTGNEKYKQILLKSSESLSTRYSDHTGLIRSWDFNRDVWQYPVIIDNMMNLELLEWASKHSGNAKFSEIARSHADLTMRHHFRPDYSCWHVVSYDTLTGQPEKKHTHQGYSHESCWSRGEAWALYGYTMMYRETGMETYLKHAEHVAGFIMNHPNLPEDKIPYWDFDAPDIPNVLRDASAAAIMASAFIELSRLSKSESTDDYLAIAEMQLKTLTSPTYLAKQGTNGNFILKHSVGNMPENSEIDTPLTYADYYYVEALLHYRKL
jgi:hypothetical protein